MESGYMCKSKLLIGLNMIYCIHRVYKEIGHNIVVNVDWSHIALSIRMRHSVGHRLSIVLKISSRKCFNAHMFICTRYTAVVFVYFMALSPEILLQKNVKTDIAIFSPHIKSVIVNDN